MKHSMHRQQTAALKRGTYRESLILGWTRKAAHKNANSTADFVNALQVLCAQNDDVLIFVEN